jgi:hypothetical protein
MSVSMRRLAPGTLVLAILLTPGTLIAQSIFATQGLGFPLEPMDARARALGSVGTGLFGGSLTPLDPASATGLLIPTANLTLQPYWSEASLDGEPLSGQGMRFPLFGLAYPVPALNGMISLTYGGYMDQRYRVEVKGTEFLSGVPVPVTDFYSSEGGISTFRLGWAQLFGRSLSLSAGVGYHTGSVTRTFVRSFDPLSVETVQIKAFTDGGKWKYGGLAGSLGAVWDPLDFIRVSGSVSWNGTLEAEPLLITGGGAASYDIPTEFRIGASGVLTPRLSLTFGMSYADWKPSPEGLGAETVAGAVMSFGGGIEWQGGGIGSRTLPIRLGMRRSDLPFLLNGEKPIETLFSGGFGLNLTQADSFVLAGVDMAVERGSREAGAFSEDFWRGTFTFRVSGW